MGRSVAECTSNLKLWIRLATCVTFGLVLALTPGGAQMARAARVGKSEVFSNPILPGDHPDPSVIRVGKTYWTASTSGDWSPQFALYKSKDLHDWKPVTAVFPKEHPDWSDGPFWAPELVSDGGRVLVYYAARRRNGPLCVAVAAAAKPEGPYTDYGPLECQADGSIDPAFVRDEDGTPYLLWKEDGNSVQLPTPIWAQPLTKDLLHLTGTKTEILVNDPQSWEGGVVEAPYVMRHAGYFYLFYAGNACCGVKCNYAEGVARSKKLLGTWERDPANPVIRPNETWRCPGHGSAVTTAKGEDYFLYHAYPVKGTVYLGRESVLDRITWSSDGWPEVNEGKGPGQVVPATGTGDVRDGFRGKVLGTEWRWPLTEDPEATVRGGKLTLTVGPAGAWEVVARGVEAPNYVAEVTVGAAGGTPGEAMGSLSVMGNGHHATGLGRRGDAVELWSVDKAGRHVLWQGSGAGSKGVRMRVTSAGDGSQLAYAYSVNGRNWTPAGKEINTSALPPWDQGLRVGFAVEGTAGQMSSFEHFLLQRR